jgi:cytosine/adenosine deaminase-related metal-dependent hydrolase
MMWCLTAWQTVCRVAVASLFLVGVAAAQQPAAPVESGTYRLYKFEQSIGEETYTITREDDSLVLTDKFLFTDRGSRVPLETVFRAAADLTPRSFESNGKSSRLSNVNVDVRVQQATTPKRFFVINGYSPVAQQMLMLRYWLRHGSPVPLPILPEGNLEIRKRGLERVSVNGSTATLTRYSISGLIWGREVVWLDAKQRLVALVGNDAEFDHFEATAAGYESLLPNFVSNAAQDGMAALAEMSQALRVTQKGPLAIVGATLIDGTGRTPVPDSVVVVNNGRIVSVGTRSSSRIPDGATVFDATGKTLLPGLWDMHAHFEQVEWGAIYLAAGVTTVRDVANELEFIVAVRNALREGRGLGPQMLLAGVVDGSGPTAIGVERVDSRADAERWVAEYKKAGFEQMKIYSSVKLDEVKAVSEAAHRAGMTVTGHIPNGMDVFQGVEAGMDQVNHIQYLLAPLPPQPPDGASRDARLQALASVDVNGPDARREIEFLKQHNTVVDPTLALYEWIYHPADQPVSTFEPGVTRVAPELAQPLNNSGVPVEAVAVSRRIFDNSVAMVGALHTAGVRVVAGTDQAIPGHSLHREIELYVQAGFTPLEAIQAATVVPAQVMGLDKEVGTVEVNKRADLILLDANPLDDVHNIRTVKYVVANGVIYPTATLWESVGFKP